MIFIVRLSVMYIAYITWRIISRECCPVGGCDSRDGYAMNADVGPRSL